MARASAVSPFIFDGPLPPDHLVGREEEVEWLLEAALAGRLTSVYAPRRYGKTSLLTTVVHQLREVHGLAAVLVDLLGVVSLADVAIRLERAYGRHLMGPVRRRIETHLTAQGLGLSLGGGGFALALQRQPRTDPLPALHALLDLPQRLGGAPRTFVVFDEFQSVMDIAGAEALIRSHVQHHRDVASYAFAGSEPGLMERAFADRRRPLYAQAQALRLGRLPEDAVVSFVARAFSTSGREAGDRGGALLAVAAGHPQRTMLLAHLLWSEVPEGRTAGEDDWERALAAAESLTRPEHEARWAALTANRRRVLRALVQYGSPMAADAVAALALPKGSAGRAIDTVIAEGDVERGPSGALRIVDPMFARWVATLG